MRTADSVPDTTIFNFESSRAEYPGFKIYCPSLYPTRAAPIGPAKGTPEIAKAAEVPISATISGSVSFSTDITVITTWTSFRNPLGNNGRIGLSIKRLVSVSFSVGLPSRRKNPPGIFPAAYVLS